MENRLQQLLLSSCLTGGLMLSQSVWAAPKIDAEYLDVGFHIGTLNVEEFGSEVGFGLNANFRASEDFFLQFNYMQADISEARIEELFITNPTGGSISDDRDYTAYNFLLGYNLFQGEFFPSEGKADLSSFYVVGGVGEKDFGGQTEFTWVYGLGYQFTLADNYILKVDYKALNYDSSLGLNEKVSVTDTYLSFGLNYLF